MVSKAKFINEITVIDPDSGNNVQVSLFKHERGGIFGMDSGFIKQVFGEGNSIIPDLFEPFDDGIFIANEGLNLIGI